MGIFVSRNHSQSLSVEIVHFSITLLWGFHTFHLWSYEKSATAVRRSFFFMDFSKQVEIQIMSSPVYRCAATQAQVSPGAAHNSLRGMSAQAILMGIPFPHTLGCPPHVGWSAAKAPSSKTDRSTAFVWWCHASQQDFILGTSFAIRQVAFS